MGDGSIGREIRGLWFCLRCGTLLVRSAKELFFEDHLYSFTLSLEGIPQVGGGSASWKNIDQGTVPGRHGVQPLERTSLPHRRIPGDHYKPHCSKDPVTDEAVSSGGRGERSATLSDEDGGSLKGEAGDSPPPSLLVTLWRLKESPGEREGRSALAKLSFRREVTQKGGGPQARQNSGAWGP